MERISLWAIIILLAAAVIFLIKRNFQLSAVILQKKIVPNLKRSQPQKKFDFAASQNFLPSSDSIHLQLEILRQALNVTTVVLLWENRKDKTLQIIGAASLRDDIITSPFPRASGITGGLGKQCQEIAVVPIAQHLSTIPYYPSNKNVGALLAHFIPLTNAILCLDRQETSPWSSSEKELVQLIVQKLSQDLRADRKMDETSRDKKAIQQICTGLLELNQVLGLQAVFQATIKTVRNFIEADFVAISLLQDKEHCIVKAYGPKCEELEGLCFPEEDGLVGQAIKVRRWMPPHSNYQGAAPIFSAHLWTLDFQSLLVLPLLKANNEPIGALTIARQEAETFTPEKRSILESIAAQVTTKIELARAHEKIYQLATTDGLTGLSNHRTFQNAFDNMLSRAKRQSTPLAIVLCDLDHFKQVNDTYGHPVGDMVLQKVANILENTIRSVDLAARYGGEEFALLLENSDSQGACIQAERVRKAIAHLQFSHEGKQFSISMSFGLAAFPQDATQKSDLIQQADQALYQAKKRGRNCTVAWAEDF